MTAIRTLSLVLATAALLLLSPPSAQAEAPVEQPMIVKVHADWCGTCRRLDATFEVLEREVGTRARIVVLDVTDDKRSTRARRQAAELGIEAFFDEYQRRTGTVGILAADGTPIEVLKGERRVEKYVEILDRVEADAS